MRDALGDKSEKDNYISLISNTLSNIDDKIRHTEDGWSMQRVVRYGGALFHATFKVPPNGMVEMTDDQPLASDLPIKSLNTVGYFILT